MGNGNGERRIQTQTAAVVAYFVHYNNDFIVTTSLIAGVDSWPS